MTSVYVVIYKGTIDGIYGIKKYRKEVVFDDQMKEMLEIEAKRNGMTVAGSIKYCVMEKNKVIYVYLMYHYEKWTIWSKIRNEIKWKYILLL